jgi:hypothetical protein
VLRRRFATGRTHVAGSELPRWDCSPLVAGTTNFEAYFGHFRVKEVFTIPCAGTGDVSFDLLGLGLHADQRCLLSPSGVGARMVFSRGARGAVLEQSPRQFIASLKLVMHVRSNPVPLYPGI